MGKIDSLTGAVASKKVTEVRVFCFSIRRLPVWVMRMLLNSKAY